MFKRLFRGSPLILVLVLCAYATQIMSSAKQSVLARKIDSTDREQVLVTITGIAGDPISKSKFKKNSKLTFDWAKGKNKLEAVYEDGTSVPGLIVSPEDAPKGSEITINKQNIAISLPVSALSNTVEVALVVPNDGKKYEIISGTEAMTEAIARSTKNSPHVLSNKTVLFGNTEKLKIFKHKHTKIYVISKDCVDSITIAPETVKQSGARLTLTINASCVATLE